LSRLGDPIEVQDRRRNVEDADGKPHQSHVSLDIWADRDENPGHIIAILEIVFGNDGSIAAVIVS
jgi:hypothetical protein